MSEILSSDLDPNVKTSREDNFQLPHRENENNYDTLMDQFSDQIRNIFSENIQSYTNISSDIFGKLSEGNQKAAYIYAYTIINY